MANDLLTTDLITKRAVIEFKNAMVLGNLVDRQWDSTVSESGLGGTIRIRRPNMFESGSGADVTSTIRDAEESYTTLTLDNRKHVAMSFSSQELTLNIEEFTERYTKPAMIELAQQVETSLAGSYTEIYNSNGTPGTTPANFLAVGGNRTIMNNTGVPTDRRSTIYNPEAGLTIANDMKLVNPDKIARTAIEEARIHRFASQDIFESPSIVNHLVGPLGGTPLVDGAAENVTYESSKNTWTQALSTKGWTTAAASRLLEGDIFTIADVFQVNPRTRQSTGNLRQFVVRANFSSDSSGDGDVTIAPPIITSGAYQTVDSVPADSAAITVLGTAATSYPQNLAIQKNAITLGFAPLAAPIGEAMSSRQTLDGVSVRMAGQWNVITDINTWRYDVLYGIKVQNPGFAVRHWG